MKDIPLREIREEALLVLVVLFTVLSAVSGAKIRRREKRNSVAWGLELRHSAYGRLLGLAEKRYAR